MKNMGQHAFAMSDDRTCLMLGRKINRKVKYENYNLDTSNISWEIPYDVSSNEKSPCDASYSNMNNIQCQVLGTLIDPTQPTCQLINTKMQASMIFFVADLAIKLGKMIWGVAQEGGREIRDTHAIERNLGVRKRHQSRGFDLILQVGDGNVNDQVYETLMKNYLGPIILKVRRSERIRHVYDDTIFFIGKTRSGPIIVFGEKPWFSVLHRGENLFIKTRGMNIIANISLVKGRNAKTWRITLCRWHQIGKNLPKFLLY